MATYYSSSNYGTKYYISFTDECGVSITLYIKQRSYSSRKYRIGRIQGLNFQIQGNEEVDSPIVKTNLQITLLDDMYYPGVDTAGIKYDGGTYYRYGNWVEFYTPDSTKYLVELYRNGLICWRGYITPDSYSESLDAYGNVTITARDNIGHMQDFDFDLTGNTAGLVKVTDLITQAFSKIAFPMNLTTFGFNSSSDKYLISEDGSYYLEDLYFNAAALEGETYYDALENILNSLGLCLRYTDDAVFYLTPLRAMPYCGYNESEASVEQPSQELQFYGRRSGTRTFEPAYRQIVENVNFEQEDEFTPEILFAKTGTKTVGTTTYTSFFNQKDCVDPGNAKHDHEATLSVTKPYVTGSTYPPGGYRGWSIVPTTHILDDESYALQEATEESEGESMHDYLFLAANVGTVDDSKTDWVYNWTSVAHGFARKVRSTQLKATFRFAAHPAGFDSNNKLGVLQSHNLKQVYYRIFYSNGSTTRYWNGEYWQQPYIQNVIEFDPINSITEAVEFDLLECEELGANGTLYIYLDKIIYQSVGYYYTGSSGSYVFNWYWSQGVYARLKSVTFSSIITRRAQSDTVTTICNAAYNVRCERNPLLGFLPISVNFVDPINYKNAFFVYDSSNNIQAAPYKWRWNTDSVALAFPVKVHQQILMYHYTTEELLEGECSNVRMSLLYFEARYEYKSKSYLLKSCTLDLIKGRFTTAEFRSYKNYTDLWSGDETYNNDKLS